MHMIRRRIGEFYLRELIGAGGMSEVYLATNPRSGERRAVKILARKATTSPLLYQRFQREIEIIKKLDHPNIITILDSGAQDDILYYMMPYLPCGNLGDYLRRERPILGRIIELLLPVCDAMAYAHQRVIVHRDLKPSNILIREDGTALVADFGIAKVLHQEGESITRSNEIMGTIAYLAPEQRMSTKRVGPAVDVFALGAVLYEAVMGFPPMGSFPLPTELKPAFPEDLQAILVKSLACRAEDRHRDAEELARDLRKFVRDQQPCADPLDPSHRIIASAPDRVEVVCERDRVEDWFARLEAGTSGERIGAVREMKREMSRETAAGLVVRFPTLSPRVRWGLIQVFGAFRMREAVPLIVQEIRNPLHREAAIEGLGRIGAPESFQPLVDYLQGNPAGAPITLVPLARTGQTAALPIIEQFMSHEMATIRQAAIRAVREIAHPNALRLLQERLKVETDREVRIFMERSIRELESRLSASLDTVHSGAGP